MYVATTWYYFERTGLWKRSAGCLYEGVELYRVDSMDCLAFLLVLFPKLIKETSLNALIV